MNATQVAQSLIRQDNDLMDSSDQHPKGDANVAKFRMYSYPLSPTEPTLVFEVTVTAITVEDDKE